MATGGGWLGEEPDKPTKEELEAHAKVERYYRWMQHHIDVQRGRFELRYEHDMPPMAVTEAGESEMTDEMWRAAGFVPVDDADGEQVGWQSVPGWR